MKLTALEAFADNHRGIIDDGARALVVEPVEPGPVAAVPDSRGLELAAILVTRHRGDHVAAIEVSRGDDLASPASSSVAADMRTWKNDFR